MLVTSDISMVPQLKRLWKICFGDSDGYIDNFFKNAYVPEHTMIYVKNGQAAGAAYLFPCEIKGRRASYLYAGGVFPEFRRQGIYEEMMHEWSRWCIERDIIPFLKPADDKLWEYYKKIGFHEFIGGKCVVIDGSGTDKCTVSGIGSAEFAAMRDDKYIKWHHMDYIFRENEICGSSCIRVSTQRGECAMVYAVIDEVMYVRGFAGDIDVLKSCSADLMKKTGAKRIYVTVNGDKMHITAAVGAEKMTDVAADLLMD